MFKFKVGDVVTDGYFKYVVAADMGDGWVTIKMPHCGLMHRVRADQLELA